MIFRMHKERRRQSERTGILESRSPVRLTVARNEWLVVIAVPKRPTFVIFKPVARGKKAGRAGNPTVADPESDGTAEYARLDRKGKGDQ